MISKFHALNIKSKFIIGCSSLIIIACCLFFGLALALAPNEQETSITEIATNTFEVVIETPEKNEVAVEVSSSDNVDSLTVTIVPTEVVDSTQTPTPKPPEIIIPTQTPVPTPAPIFAPTSDPSQFLDIQIEKTPDEYDGMPKFGLRGGSGTGGSDVYFFVHTIGEDAASEGGNLFGSGNAKIELEYQIVDNGVTIESHKDEAEGVTGIGYRYEIQKDTSNTLPRTSDYDGLTFIINLYADGYLLDTFEAIKSGDDWLPIATVDQGEIDSQVAEEMARCAKLVRQVGDDAPEYVGLQGYLTAKPASDYSEAFTQPSMDNSLV